MALYPMPVHFVPGQRLLKCLPQLGILHRLLVGGAPAMTLPSMYPFGDTVAHVNRVCIERDGARPLERVERFDGGGQFHAVVGGGGLAATQFLAVAS